MSYHPFLREKDTFFTVPVRLSISEAALPVSDNVGSTASGLFFTWCLRPQPNVGVVVSPDFAGTSAFKQDLRARRTSGSEGFVLDCPAFLPGFTWVFCAGVFSPELHCTITVFCLGVISPPGILRVSCMTGKVAGRA